LKSGDCGGDHAAQLFARKMQKRVAAAGLGSGRFPIRSAFTIGAIAPGLALRQLPRRMRGFAGSESNPPSVHSTRRSMTRGGVDPSEICQEWVATSKAALTVCTSARRQHRISVLVRYAARMVVKTTTNGEVRVHARHAHANRPHMEARRVMEKLPKYSPERICDRVAGRNSTSARSTRSTFQSIQYNSRGKIHPHVRRQGQGSRQAGLSARHRRRQRSGEPSIGRRPLPTSGLQYFTLMEGTSNSSRRYSHAVSFSPNGRA
jgi:hypothetical protein